MMHRLFLSFLFIFINLLIFIAMIWSGLQKQKDELGQQVAYIQALAVSEESTNDGMPLMVELTDLKTLNIPPVFSQVILYRQGQQIDSIGSLGPFDIWTFDAPLGGANAHYVLRFFAHPDSSQLPMLFSFMISFISTLALLTLYLVSKKYISRKQR